MLPLERLDGTGQKEVSNARDGIIVGDTLKIFHPREKILFISQRTATPFSPPMHSFLSHAKTPRACGD